MLSIAEDLQAEAEELHAFLLTLEEPDWRTPTLFMAWTPWDIVAHLHYFDRVSLLALTDRDAFDESRKRVMLDLEAGKGTTEQQRTALAEYDFPSLLAHWKSTCDELAQQLGESPPKRRLPWFGPDMGVPMFTTARYMETWAHAQAIYDLKKKPRAHTDRIKNICTIGVKTFGWTFVNRGLEVPEFAPHLRLTAPSGAIWEWNDPSDEECIEGDALDFCLTVTQVRNFADTGLRVRGEVANHWMEIAQCFAGGPVDPPVAGYRTGGVGADPSGAT